MTNVETLAFVAATDAAFRRSLKENPQRAAAARALYLDAEELAAVSALHHLLSLSPPELHAWMNQAPRMQMNQT